MPVQIRNGEMSKLGTIDNQYRFDPAIGFAEMGNIFLSLPGVVGFWPGNLRGSSSSSGTELSDRGPRRLNLTQNGGAVLSANADKLAVWQQYNGSSDWFSHADASAFDITGALTIMAWVNFDATASANEYIAGKWAGSNQSYLLLRIPTGEGRFVVSTDGSTGVNVNTTATLTASKWYFLCGRFSPSVELKVWLGSISNLAINVNTTSIPATIFNGNADFCIGAGSGGASKVDGAIGPVALCNVALPDVFIDVAFQRTRQVFGAI